MLHSSCFVVTATYEKNQVPALQCALCVTNIQAIIQCILYNISVKNNTTKLAESTLGQGLTFNS